MAAVETLPSGSVRQDSDFSRLWLARAISDLGSALDAGVLGTLLGVTGALWVSVAVLAVSALQLPRKNVIHAHP